MLAMVVDVMRNPAFPEAEFVKRQAECVSALRQDEDNPAVRAVEAMFELLYGPVHPYGRRAKGTLESVARITRDDLVAHHRAHVRAGEAVAGDRRRRQRRAGDRSRGGGAGRDGRRPLPPMTRRCRSRRGSPGGARP